MLGKTHLAEIADKVLRLSEADQTEIALSTDHSHVTRFGENEIHQNVSRTDAVVRIRGIFGQHESVASSNDLSDSGLKKLLQQLKQITNTGSGGLGERMLPAPAPILPVAGHCDRTADFSPIERAQGVEKITRLAEAAGLLSGGGFSTGETETYVANSNGVRAYHCGTLASLIVVAMSDDSSGFASDASANVDDLNPSAIGEAAIDKALKGRSPQPIPHGEYTVILEEGAVADLVSFLSNMGMNARSFQEGRSFMEGRIGERVTGEEVTIWDDGHDPRGIPVSFDAEGVPKQKVMLVEKGIARGFVYDTVTAAREPGAVSTGHALAAPSPYGPSARNLFMAPGSATIEEMISSTRKGLLISRFHYTNALHPKRTLITGMTRDGTFLIEDGRIAHPVQDLRFTQSILEAFANIEMLGSNSKLIKNVWAPIGTYVPAAKIRGFHFTGSKSTTANRGNGHA